MYILEIISGTAFVQTVALQNPCQTGCLYGLLNKKEESTLVEIRILFHTPSSVSQWTSYFSKAVSDIVHDVSPILPCSFTLLPLRAVNQSLPHPTTSWSLQGLLLAVTSQGEQENRLTAEGHTLPFLTVLSHMRTCGVWQQQPCYSWCCRKTLQVSPAGLSHPLPYRGCSWNSNQPNLKNQPNKEGEKRYGSAGNILCHLRKASCQLLLSAEEYV